MSICRSCEMDFRYSYQSKESYDHTISDHFECLICGYEKAFVHDNDDFWGSSIECASCHNYIKYINPEGHLWKDEFYIDKYCLIRNVEDNCSTILVDNLKAITVNMVLQFTSIAQLHDRIKTIVVFS